jgi:hypothetical protein
MNQTHSETACCALLLCLWLVSFLNLGPPLEEVDLGVLCLLMGSDLVSVGSPPQDDHLHFHNLDVPVVLVLRQPVCEAGGSLGAMMCRGFEIVRCKTFLWFGYIVLLLLLS